jgi:DNA-binding NtrC family response regulator
VALCGEGSDLEAALLPLDHASPAGAHQLLSARRPEAAQMPAQIVVVHNDAAFSGPVSRALREDDHDVMVFPDPLVALNALEAAEQVKLLITRVEFPAGRSNGMALALMARRKRPGVKVLFVCRPPFRKHVEDLGEVLTTPVSIAEVVEAAARLLAHAAPETLVKVQDR